MLRCHRFLTQVWEYSQREARRRRAAARRERRRGEPSKDTTEHLRLKLAQWCEAAVERTTEDMESLEMHSAVRNVMRLFDRIKDFEKRVLARERALSRGQPRGAARGARAARADARPVRPAPRRGAVDRARPRGARRTDAVARRIVRGARMSTQTAQSPRRAPGSGRARARPSWPATAATTATRSSDTVFACPDCGKGLDIVYDYELAARHFARGPRRASARRTSGTSRSCCRSSTPPRRRASGSSPATRR